MVKGIQKKFGGKWFLNPSLWYVLGYDKERGIHKIFGGKRLFTRHGPPAPKNVGQLISEYIDSEKKYCGFYARKLIIAKFQIL